MKTIIGASGHTDFPAQDGLVRTPIPFVERRFVAGKPSINRQVVSEVEGGITVNAVGGPVSPFGHPDLSHLATIGRGGQGPGQSLKGVFPRGAVAKTGSIGIDVHHRTRRTDMGFLPERNETFKLCQENGKGIVAMKTFAKGKLLKLKKKEKIAGYITGGIKLTTRIPSTMTSAKCLHYTLSQPGVTLAVPRASSIEELRDCVNYVNVPESEKGYETELEELFLNEISK